MLKKKNRYEKLLQSIETNNPDVIKRVISGQGGEIIILYVKELTDREALSEQALKPLTIYVSSGKEKITVDNALNHIIYADDCREDTDENKIIEYILTGFTVFLFPQEEKYLFINFKKVEKRSISEPELTYTLRGPRDCFIENLDANVSTIRYRIKDPALKIDMMQSGRRTKTRIAVAYIKNIVNLNLVKDITERINNIDVDGIVDSGELQRLMLNNKLNLFPQMGIVERSDMAASALLEGKVIILIEGSNLGLVAPKVFGEFLQSCDDIYDNKYIGLFSKILRIVAIIFSITLSSLFIAVCSFNHDLLTPDYILTAAISRSNVPFNSLTGVLLMETTLEILREALLRVPKQIGSAIGIVGAIIFGQAAIAAGIFSPLLLILGSLSFLASFVAPDYTITNPLRVMKILCISMTAIFGIIGLVYAILFIVVNLICSNSFGTPYMTPLAPFNWYEFTRWFLYDKRLAPKRPGFLQTQDKYRIKHDNKK